MIDIWINGGIACLFILQGLITYHTIGDLFKDEADREDVLMLIPLYWIIPFVRLMAERIPKAMKRPPRK